MIKINITYIKLLDSIESLNKKFFYPSIKGIEKYINGKIDNDTEKFINHESFSCLLSLKGRKLSSKLYQLIRYKYLEYKLNPKDELLYLKISNLGVVTLNKYKLNHKIVYKDKKVNTKNKVEIVNIK